MTASPNVVMFPGVKSVPATTKKTFCDIVDEINQEQKPKPIVEVKSKIAADAQKLMLAIFELEVQASDLAKAHGKSAMFSDASRVLGGVRLHLQKCIPNIEKKEGKK